MAKTKAGMKSPTKETVEKMMEEAVHKGHMECNPEGEYRFTESGRQAVIIHSLLEAFDCQHDAAFTFAALVQVTSLSPADVVLGLIQLISDEVVHYGKVAAWPSATIFYLCPHQERLEVFGGEGEQPKSPLYQAEVREILVSVSPSENT